MRNLNTHSAYLGLRRRRAALRAEGRHPDGFELAKTLARYSERGEAYENSLHTIMRGNALLAADRARLRDEEPV